MHTQNDICNTCVLSNPVEFYSFYSQHKFKLTVSLAQEDLRTPQAKALQFCCCKGICKNVILMYFMGKIIYTLQICIYLKL